MATNNNNTEIYRKARIGLALQEALDELSQSEDMPDILANNILQQFDESIATVLSQKLIDKKIIFKVSRSYILIKTYINNYIHACDYFKIADYLIPQEFDML